MQLEYDAASGSLDVVTAAPPAPSAPSAPPSQPAQAPVAPYGAIGAPVAPPGPGKLVLLCFWKCLKSHYVAVCCSPFCWCIIIYDRCIKRVLKAPTYWLGEKGLQVFCIENYWEIHGVVLPLTQAHAFGFGCLTSLTGDLQAMSSPFEFLMASSRDKPSRLWCRMDVLYPWWCRATNSREILGSRESLQVGCRKYQKIITHQILFLHFPTLLTSWCLWHPLTTNWPNFRFVHWILRQTWRRHVIQGKTMWSDI